MAVEHEPEVQLERAERGLDRLIQLSARHAWNLETDVDWHTPLPVLRGEERDALASLLSLIYWSDRSGQSSLALMADHLERRFWRDGTYQPQELMLKVQSFLRIQREDEVRHAETLARLIGLLGTPIAPPTPVHARVLRALAAGLDFDEKLVIIHWLVEIYAKLLFEQLRVRFAGTLVEEVFGRILPDESRHIAFGDFYFPVRLEEATPGELVGLWRAQLEHLGLMAWAAITEPHARAARLLDLDVRKFYLDGLDAMEQRHERLGRPLAPANLSPWLRPLAAFVG